MVKEKGRRVSTLGSRLSSLASVALVLALLGVAALTAVAGYRISDEVRRNIGFTVKLSRDAQQRDIDRLKKALLESGAVEVLTYTSADDILRAESEYLDEDILAVVDENPYSAELDVKVRAAYSVPDSIAALVERWSGAPAVESIVTESAVVEGVDATLRRVGLTLAVLGLVLLFVSVALIYNTISLSIYARRFVIHTMKLVGATASFIRRPFIRAAIGGGICAGAVAAAAVAALRYYAGRLDPIVDAALPWEAVSAIAAAMILAGAAVCGLTAAVAAGRYLRSSYDSMFLK